MVDPVCILTFPEELLIKIFEFCDVQSLGRLERTCQRFKQIIYTEESCWREKCTNVICSNMISKLMQLRSKPFLSSRQRCEVSRRRWEKGLNVRRTLVKYSGVASWMDPYDNVIYCVQSDHNVTIMSGASRSGLIQVWDKRKPEQECLQQYSEYDSPAYSLAFDASHLFGAYDKAVVQYSYLW